MLISFYINFDKNHLFYTKNYPANSIGIIFVHVYLKHQFVLYDKLLRSVFKRVSGCLLF